ncbi:MAG: DUF2075 domain-containing protein [Acholeplasmatales bacterium]|nr:DUF2075 domain-containing protein [Acholeplasmatales bacterium]
MEPRLRKTPGRTYYESTIEDFALNQNPNDIVDFLVESDEYTEPYQLHLQKGAWSNQIKILKKYLQDKKGYIIFEYVLSRVNMRIDVVLLMDDIVYSLEFKNNEVTFNDDDINQADGYGYALKNFYEVNRNKYVVPILIATKAPDSICSSGADLGIDKLFSLFKANTNKMEQYIDLIRSKYGSDIIYTEEEFEEWVNSPFKPNPTIIQSARSIYMNNQVDEFFKFDAGEENLKITESTVEEIIKEARDNKKKIICFVSGVPGAGKTLVGLDIAGKTRNKENNDMPEAVFFSGNGPLINVLTEALGRDAMKANPEKFPNKNRAVNDVKTFIQDLHAFKQDIISSKKRVIDENVLIFDEAQRVWDKEQLEKWLEKKGAEESYFGNSEADLLLSTFDKKEWGVIVALVGLGQDIHTGEDGLGVWFNSLLNKKTEWDIRLSNEIFDQRADKLDAYIDSIKNCDRVKECPGLYLKTCIRTPRAKNLSEFSEALLNNRPEDAKKALEKFDDYPICITRNLKHAEQFLLDNTLRKERCGKLCSSNSKILGRYSHSFDNIDNWHFANWMLDESGRDSSNSLVFAASEFNIQGLEIDWSLLAWDMDMYYHNGEWHEQKMLTPKRFKESTEVQKKHILNSYRVLLTRARKGMIIYIPKAGDYEDNYAVSDYFDSTYEYLKSCGIKDIDEIREYTRIPNAIELPF